VGLADETDVLGGTGLVGRCVRTRGVVTARGAVFMYAEGSRGDSSNGVRKENAREMLRLADRFANAAVRHREWIAHRSLFLR